MHFGAKSCDKALDNQDWIQEIPKQLHNQPQDNLKYTTQFSFYYLSELALYMHFTWQFNNNLTF